MRDKIQPLSPEKRRELEGELQTQQNRACQARLSQLQPAVRDKTAAQIHDQQASAGATLRDARSKIETLERILKFDDELKNPPQPDPAQHHRMKTFGQAATDGDLL